MVSKENPGNLYCLVTTDFGLPAFKHVQTGQILHSHIGAYQEAWQLYVEQSDVLNRKGHCTVFDIGLGCASQVIAFRDAFNKNSQLGSMNVISFDLEKEGLGALLEALDSFPFAQPHAKLLSGMNAENKITEALPDGRIFSWQFVEGDFVRKKDVATLPQTNIVCYDFFSPSEHPQLWTFACTKRIFDLCTDDAIFVTYCTATAIRANLLAAGFFVGDNPEHRMRMTLASKTRELIPSLLNERWLLKFNRSTLPFIPLENEDTCNFIRDAVNNHAQFRE